VCRSIRPGGDDVTRHVTHVGSRIGLELVTDHHHLAGGEGDIHHGIKLPGGVDHPTAAQDQIERRCNLRRRGGTSVCSCSQPGLDMRHGIDQLARVSGLRVIEHGAAFALLDDAAILQHDGPVAHHANDVEVVADKEEC
jgi:hypothetical protein